MKPVYLEKNISEQGDKAKTKKFTGHIDGIRVLLAIRNPDEKPWLFPKQTHLITYLLVLCKRNEDDDYRSFCSVVLSNLFLHNFPDLSNCPVDYEPH